MKPVWMNSIGGGSYGWMHGTPYALRVYPQPDGKWAWHVWKSPGYMANKLPEAFGHDAATEAKAKAFAVMAVEELLERGAK